MSVVRVFARCNGGHYFVGKWCPFDGWGSEETEAIERVADDLFEKRAVPTMASLEAAGLPPKTLARACVIPFYSNDQALEGIEPNLVALGGHAYLLKDAPESVK